MRSRWAVLYSLLITCITFTAFRHLPITIVKTNAMSNGLGQIIIGSTEKTRTIQTVTYVGSENFNKYTWVKPKSHPFQVRKFQASNSSMKMIVWFDVYHDGHGLRNKARNVDFNKCKFKDCTLSLYSPDTDYSVHNPMAADALIFQLAHLHLWPVPPRRLSQDIPFILAEREGFLPMVKSKFENQGNYSRYRDVFNWTMTFRRDSDIFLPYGEFRERKLANYVANIADTVTVKEKLENVYRQKSKGAIWLVSHCETRSFREEYVKELKKYTNVDIYGRCGETICRRGSTVQDRGCLNDIIKQYKFVLNFENTFYTDYVTEKLFDWFPVDIIQVVYGSAKYSEFVPNGTIVDAGDFDSPQALGEYLNVLGNSENDYIEFLAKKKNYYTIQHDKMQQRAYCDLCKRLHNIKSYRRSYSHMGDWWEPDDVTKIVNTFVLEPERKKEFFNRMKNFRYLFSKRLRNTAFNFV